MHPFGHIEIPTTDLQQAKRFYGAVFGWTFTHIPEIDYTLIHTGKHPNGGLELVKRISKGFQAVPYIEVTDIDDTLKAIRKARGKVLEKRTQVGTMGWRARFQAPDGVVLSLWQSAPRL